MVSGEGFHLYHNRKIVLLIKVLLFRYLMLIDGESEVYMFDRDNNVFHVSGLTFPYRKEDRHIVGTLVDGVNALTDSLDS